MVRRCRDAVDVAAEIARHIPRLAEQRKLEAPLLFAALAVMPIDWTPGASYEHRRAEAEARVATRDPMTGRPPRSRSSYSSRSGRKAKT